MTFVLAMKLNTVTAGKIEIIQKHHVIDLGNRQFKVINSHTTERQR
ncbi:MAG: hypothetical protein ACJAVV_003544 [Alphaproteobacteria bacterium]|jgi:hypothetical protein